MSFTLLEYALWPMAPVLQVLTSIAMLKRRLVRDFPWFFAYTVFQVLRSGAQFYVGHWMGYDYYFWTYWSLQVIGSLLGFAVIYEVYCHVFRTYDAIRRLGSLLFRWASTVLLMVAVVVAASTNGSDVSRTMAAVLALEVSVRVMQCGLLFLLFLLSGYFGLSWRQYVFGIALGFGLFASVELSAVAMRAHLGRVAGAAWGLVNSSSYVCAALVWASYFVLPRPAARKVEKLPKYDLEAWNQALVQLLSR